MNNSMTSIAKEMNISISTLSSKLSGDRSCSYKEKEKIEEYFPYIKFIETKPIKNEKRFIVLDKGIEKESKKLMREIDKRIDIYIKISKQQVNKINKMIERLEVLQGR